MSASQYALEIEDLSVEFSTHGGTVKAVRGVSFRLEKGKTLAIVGESGCGKSVSVQSLMGLIPSPPGRITSGSALLDGEQILGLKQQYLNQYRGKRIAMIFQDPMSAMNPTMTVGQQIAETLVVHKGLSKAAADHEVLSLLEQVQIPDPAARAKQYPFEFSGGMLQRAVIAMSIACKPEVLIADEPTTALDVTTQAQILKLLKSLQENYGISIVLITHDLGVVAQMAHDVAVMYAGKVVESGNVDDIFYRPSHPYTVGLQQAMPNNEPGHSTLVSIPGSPPDLFAPPAGCSFAPRCPHAMKLCYQQQPPLAGTDHQSACWLLHDMAADNAFKARLQESS